MSHLPRISPRAVLVLVLVLAVGLLGGCGFLRRRAANRPPFKKLSPPIAFEMMRDNPEMLVLDLRPPQEYNGETGHIRRARNIPVERLPYRLLEISSFRDDTFLVYCRADDCGEKGMAVLLASGFENAVLMEGGIDSWIRRGFKTVLPTSGVGAGPAPKPPADGRGAVMPVRPGKPQMETNVESPPMPEPEPISSPEPPPPGGRVAAPRQIGYNS
jgi:rhodanese-related sulfurtransferase